MTDFKLIKYQHKTISIEQYNELFQQCWNFLQSVIYQPTNKKRIVITHHLPSELCNLAEFKDSPINEGFCTDLTEEISKAYVDYWIYGHSHRNLPAFKIGDTLMLTNQLGYVRHKEHQFFDNQIVFDAGSS